jgi:hypothetical protein
VFPDPEPILTNTEKAEQLRLAHWPDADPTLTTILLDSLFPEWKKGTPKGCPSR